MLSRVAESVFWMHRYLERAENVARFVDVNYNLTLDMGEEIAQQWAPIINTTGDHEDFFERYGDDSRANALQFLTFDEKNPNSILSCLRKARENARTVRDVISLDMWEETNRLYLMLNDAAAEGMSLEDPYEFLQRIKLASHAICGATEVSMSHSDAWHFARLARLLERADKTSRILDVKYFILLPDPNAVGTPMDIVQWSALLKSASALEMYRKNYGRITPHNVAEFLILSRDFPRSIRFCLVRAEESLHAITGTASGAFANRGEQLLGRLRSDMDYTHIDDVIAMGMHEFIDHLQFRLNEAGQAVDDCFFAPAVTPRNSLMMEQLQ